MTSIWQLKIIIREMQKTGEYYVSIATAKMKEDKDKYEMLIAALLIIAPKLETQMSINSRMNKKV